jgi:hypothetical protein
MQMMEQPPEAQKLLTTKCADAPLDALPFAEQRSREPTKSGSCTFPEGDGLEMRSGDVTSTSIAS